jgi:type VI protein secretion system component VasF
MSKVPEWTYLLVAGAAFALSWLAWRLDRLGKQLEAVSSLIRQEMAELLGNEDRAREILNEWKENRAEQKKLAPHWIVWAVIGAVALAYWWFPH